MQSNEFNTGVIKPVDCMKEGWELIKSDYWLFFGITIVGLLIGGAVPIVLIGPMLCGVYYCFLKRYDGVRPEFGDMFKGFDYFVQGLIATLIIFALITPGIILMIVAYFAIIITAATSRGNPAPIIAAVIFFCVVLFIVALISACIHALIIFTHLLIVDRKMNGWDALKLSAKASWANLSGVVGFVVVMTLLNLLGLCALIFGLYLVQPIIYAGTTIMYRKIFPALGPQQNYGVPLSPGTYPQAGFGQ